MDSGDDFEVDPAIAAAMGFTGFGTQPNKKRKFQTDDGYVDPSIKPSDGDQMTGANNVPLRDNRDAKVDSSRDTASTITITGGKDNIADKAGSSKSIDNANGRTSLEALRHGVPNQRGDMAYFLPSFLEDPWEGLQPK